MAELTKKRIELMAHNILECHGLLPSEVREMARQLLASMEQEPVGEVVLGDYDDCGDYPDAKVVCIAAQGQADWNNFRNGTKLYAAPQLPQPAVPEKAITQHFDTIALDVAKMVMCDVNRRNEFLGGDVQLLSRIQCRVDEACRSAMLQGADQPQNAHQNIPENIPTFREALAAIRNLGPIDAEKIQAERDALNEPDVPDGYALVPVEPTEKMIIEGFESVPHPLFQPADWDKYQTMSGCEQAAHRAKLCWAAMIKAAPNP
ncbi:hypothetical protein [Leclercia adecarboxylata]|uniref:hypothetical protein n=1 Tax=Leclercia adecarboxylata TaxID=83655 RepID=UPI00370BFED5